MKKSVVLFSLLINPDSREPPYKHYIVMNVAPLLIGLLTRFVAGILLDLILCRPLIIPNKFTYNIILSLVIFKMMMSVTPFQAFLLGGISFIIDDRCRNFSEPRENIFISQSLKNKTCFFFSYDFDKFLKRCRKEISLLYKVNQKFAYLQTIKIRPPSE